MTTDKYQEAMLLQARIANKLRVALIDQLTEIARMMPGVGYPADPAIRIREYLTEDEWKDLNL